MRGIHSVDDLRDRCRVDDVTGCWEWAGATSAGHPCCWLPEAGRRMTLGKAIGWLRTGKEPAPGVFWYCACETKRCANPAHRRAGDRRAQMLAAKLTRTLAQRARISRARARKLDEASAAAIRASDEPLRVVAARHGVSITTCSRVRRGETWRELGASAFSQWRLAA